MAGAGYRDWTAGEKPTAAQFDTYLQEQTVMVFASSSARDTALSTAKSEGMVTFQTDTNTLTVYSGSAWSTVGPLHGAWMDWTPTLTQSGAVTKTINYGKYVRFGRTVIAQAFMTCTGSGTSSNKVTVSLPVTAATSTQIYIGSGAIIDVSTTPDAWMNAFVRIDTTTTATFWISSTAPGAATSGFALGDASSDFTAALASGDVVIINVTYEASADA